MMMSDDPEHSEKQYAYPCAKQAYEMIISEYSLTFCQHPQFFLKQSCSQKNDPGMPNLRTTPPQRDRESTGPPQYAHIGKFDQRVEPEGESEGGETSASTLHGIQRQPKASEGLLRKRRTHFLHVGHSSLDASFWLQPIHLVMVMRDVGREQKTLKHRV